MTDRIPNSQHRLRCFACLCGSLLPIMISAPARSVDVLASLPFDSMPDLHRVIVKGRQTKHYIYFGSLFCLLSEIIGR